MLEAGATSSQAPCLLRNEDGTIEPVIVGGGDDLGALLSRILPLGPDNHPSAASVGGKERAERAYKKLWVRNRADAVRQPRALGLIDLPATRSLMQRNAVGSPRICRWSPVCDQRLG